jgi:hypothetical protein
MRTVRLGGSEPLVWDWVIPSDDDYRYALGQ